MKQALFFICMTFGCLTSLQAASPWFRCDIRYQEIGEDGKAVAATSKSTIRNTKLIANREIKISGRSQTGIYKVEVFSPERGTLIKAFTTDENDGELVLTLQDDAYLGVSCAPLSK